MISSHKLREKFLQFFESKKHSQIPSSSVVVENDPTTLFIGAGMQPLVPFLAGNPHPSGKRLVNSQKCIRTVDIDEVGDDTHLTFFEMLGNWSLGDYFKESSIPWSYEFLTSKEWLGLDKSRLAVTCYQGNSKYNIPRDNESANIWRSLGIPEDRITFLGDEDNWWPKMGMEGLCGPDTEIFYWVPNNVTAPKKHDPNDERWVEIWNNVFMQYRFQDGKIKELPNKNVDTGMGFERALVAINGLNNIYESDLFAEAITKLKAQSSEPKTSETSCRIIADHIRCSMIMIADGIRPSNVDQGYILRKLLRRAIRHSKKLNITKDYITSLINIFTDKLSNTYPSLKEKQQDLINIAKEESEKFEKTLKDGMKEFEKILHGFEIAFERSGKRITQISGAKAFKLYDTYGFPIEMTKDLAMENDLTVDEEGFERAYAEHRAKSRSGSEKKFAGGLADHSEEVKRLHTATHLMLEALRQVLGNHVEQRGSNITAERLRFDFSHEEKVTPEQLKAIEDKVNEQIQAQLPIHFEEMTVQEAMDRNATGIFIDKYQNDLGGKVKVYFMGDYSTEICGGPHVENTNELGHFRITKEQASSAGVRRIKAILE